jgi:hypothetical protein
LREKHPKESTPELSIPERVALKDWSPAVRAAQRRLEGHRVIICLEVNPAYWDDLPIEQLERLQTKRTKSSKVLERIRSRSIG